MPCLYSRPGASQLQAQESKPVSAPSCMDHLLSIAVKVEFEYSNRGGVGYNVCPS